MDTIRKFTVLGTTDEVTSCDCCGKSGLKSTFAVMLHETDEVVHYGSTCVTRNTGIKNPTKAAESHRESLKKDAAQKLRWSAEYRAYEAKLAFRVHLKLTPGKESMEYVRAEYTAKQERVRAIAAEFGLEPWEVNV